MDDVPSPHHCPITPYLTPTRDFFQYQSVPDLDLDIALSKGPEVASTVEESKVEEMEVNADYDMDHVLGEEEDDMPQYYRVDEVWDNFIHDYKLVETRKVTDAQDHGDYAFYVRRRFDCEGRYLETMVDIKSKILRDILRTAMTSCPAISLHEITPTVDPNMFFLYFEDLQKHYKEIEPDGVSMLEDRKESVVQAVQLKSLLGYIERDYSEIKRTLDSLFNVECITFDLLWSLFRLNEIIYTSTYTATDEPRAFRVISISKESSLLNETWYEIQGEYFDFDGDIFGFSDVAVEIKSFTGTRRITSLPCYPIANHRDKESIERQLISRGRKFVELAGTNYKSYSGLGFTESNGEIIKVPITSKVMIDPRGFRQANPDCSSTVRSASTTEREENSPGGDNTSDIDPGERSQAWQESTQKPNSSSHEIIPKLASLEMLIASPLISGFAFSKKLWLELTVSGIQDMHWSESAFESLVLPDDQKSVIKALLQSHDLTSRSRQTVDDFITGKGRGLVMLSHGPPGVGKTLTAESLAESLRRPLYHVSIGELGTDPRHLEQGLVKISDLAHRWGAILLLDEADVFLEARVMQDVHCNALVTIFLRMLEYFSGILFLTTNRVMSLICSIQNSTSEPAVISSNCSSNVLWPPLYQRLAVHHRGPTPPRRRTL